MAFKKRFEVSDESINTYGFWIRTAGVKLEQAQRNCPAYYNHATWEIPLGHWEDIAREGDKIYATIVIEGANDEERKYIRKIENGDIKGASGGFDPLKWSTEPFDIKDGQKSPTLVESELFEISLAPLPGNKNALALKSKDGFIKLSAENQSTIIPSLNTKPDMKQIAIKLGLSENATESEITAAIIKLMAENENAVAMRQHIEQNVAEVLDTEEKKQLFVELSKTNFKQALTFLNLNKKPSENATVAETPATAGTAAKVEKNVKVSDLIQKNKANLSKAGASADGKDSFDYLQKHNQVELARIRKEEPDTYQELATGYRNGIRYTGSK